MGKGQSFQQMILEKKVTCIKTELISTLISQNTQDINTKMYYGNNFKSQNGKFSKGKYRRKSS